MLADSMVEVLQPCSKVLFPPSSAVLSVSLCFGNGCSSLWVELSGKASLAQKMCRTSRQPWTLCCCFCALCWDDVGLRAGIGTMVQHWQHVAQAEGSLSTSCLMDSKQRKGRITHKRKVLISQRLITQDCLRFKPSNFR